MVGFIVEKLYWLLIGWWYEKKVSRKLQRELEDQIRVEFSFLFSRYDAKIIDNSDLGHLAFLGATVVTLSAGTLLFRFVEHRGRRQVHVSDACHPSQWHELADLPNVFIPEKVERHSIAFFSDAASLIREHIGLIEKAFSQASHPLVVTALDDARKYDMNVAKAVENDINWRLKNR